MLGFYFGVVERRTTNARVGDVDQLEIWREVQARVAVPVND